MKKHLLVSAALLAFAAIAQGQEPPQPLQADIRVKVKASRLVGASFRARLEQNGEARFRGSVINQPGGDTALVALRFDYRIPEGRVAFDELIARIELSVEDAAGEGFSTAFIDFPRGGINLNPNRVPLDYSATLYLPPDARRNGYFVRLRVFGNYE